MDSGERLGAREVTDSYTTASNNDSEKQRVRLCGLPHFFIKKK